jgi:hypothetical protein
MVIESYFRSLLRPQLKILGLSSKQQLLVCEDVHARLDSLMRNWDDVVFRRTALLLGTEDATFYQPASVDLEIRALVVVAVRNSILEDLSADRPFTKAFIPVAHCLPDSLVPMITSQAVAFFASAYREQGGWNLSSAKRDSDLFRSLSKCFPESWRRLEILANSSLPEHDLPNETDKQFLPPPLEEDITGQAKAKTTVLSGYAPDIDPELRRMLELIKDGKIEFFFTSTFKFLTRNPKKLLTITESLLSWNRSYVTSNYLIRRDYCAKRHPLIRPPHTVAEMTGSLANESGMTERHRQCLRLVRQQFG